MSWKEKLQQYSSERFPTEGTGARKAEHTPPSAASTLSLDVRRSKADYESMVRLVNAYFEHCLHKRADGESFERVKDAQSPEFFADMYADDPQKIVRDAATLDSLSEKMDIASFFPRVVEALLWQAQKDYQILGPGVTIVPTSRFDDITKGFDLVVALPDDPGGTMLGVDVTMKQRVDPFQVSALDAKSRLKFSRGQHEETYFRHQGVFRHLDYLRDLSSHVGHQWA